MSAPVPRLPTPGRVPNRGVPDGLLIAGLALLLASVDEHTAPALGALPATEDPLRSRVVAADDFVDPC